MSLRDSETGACALSRHAARFFVTQVSRRRAEGTSHCGDLSELLEERLENVDLLDLDEYAADDGTEDGGREREGSDDSLAETGRHETIEPADADTPTEVMIAPELIFPQIELPSDDEP